MQVGSCLTELHTSEEAFASAKKLRVQFLREQLRRVLSSRPVELGARLLQVAEVSRLAAELALVTGLSSSKGALPQVTYLARHVEISVRE
jgi:hypothetical protein